MAEKLELKEQLTRYGVTAKGQIAQGRGFGACAGYAAAVGAGMAMAGGADAAIVYSGVQNLSVHIDPAWQAAQLSSGRVATLPIDLNGDGQADVLMSHSVNVGKRMGRTYYQEGGFFKPRNGAGIMNTANSNSNLAAGRLIGPGEQFGHFGAFKSGFWRAGSSSVSNPGGNFSFNVPGLVGFRLGNGDYGWIRLRFDDAGLNQPLKTLLGGSPLQDGHGFPDGMTVVDWAYDNSGAPIAAGDTGATPPTVPEPSPLALLAAGAAGITALRRRKAKQARVH